MKYWLCALALGFSVMACGGDDHDDGDGGGFSLGHSGPFACGQSTCTARQMCIHSNVARFSSATPDSESCVPLPEGCATALCDCDASEGDWEGQPITGCSILGERSLWVTNANCGSRRCTAREACVIRGAEQSCQPLPPSCSVELKFCDSECPAEVARAAGAARSSGCMGADWAVAVYVEP